MPDIFLDFLNMFSEMVSFFENFAFYIVAVLTAAAVIWTSAIAWRKFKDSTNRV